MQRGNKVSTAPPLAQDESDAWPHRYSGAHTPHAAPPFYPHAAPAAPVAAPTAAAVKTGKKAATTATAAAAAKSKGQTAAKPATAKPKSKVLAGAQADSNYPTSHTAATIASAAKAHAHAAAQSNTHAAAATAEGAVAVDGPVFDMRELLPKSPGLVSHYGESREKKKDRNESGRLKGNVNERVCVC